MLVEFAFLSHRLYFNVFLEVLIVFFTIKLLERYDLGRCFLLSGESVEHQSDVIEVVICQVWVAREMQGLK